MSSTHTGFFDSLVSAVRENPLAATLIGGGVFWLLAGDEKLRSAAHSATAAASPIIDSSGRTVRAAASVLQRTAAPPTAPEDHDESVGIGETLHGAGSAASDAMSGAADKIRSGFEEGVTYARETLGKPGKETLTKAQLSLADMLERQPLLLGAVGLAIGAAVAGAFRTSDLENELMGGLSDDMKADLNARAGAVSQSLREASDTLKAEFSDTTAEAVDRVKQAAVDAANAAQEKARSL
jgi:hypothetical protein